MSVGRFVSARGAQDVESAPSRDILCVDFFLLGFHFDFWSVFYLTREVTFLLCESALYIVLFAFKDSFRFLKCLLSSFFLAEFSKQLGLAVLVGL